MRSKKSSNKITNLKEKRLLLNNRLRKCIYLTLLFPLRNLVIYLIYFLFHGNMLFTDMLSYLMNIFCLQNVFFI